MCRGIRGATTVAEDTPDEIWRATREMLALIIRINGVRADDLASALFTTTPDLVSAFPATAARQLGWMDVPLMCGHEMAVPGSLPMCVRVLLHWNTDKSPQEIQHVYLEKAKSLRPDKADLPEIDMHELERWIDEQLARWEAK
ncbi:MAG: chorismate mutase [Caldilineaceae bacterium]|nr:chorismate mutase [Caldilineaceae bacterium]MBP8106422.1 chorismate mutase [Caldilineaceae bacterium]MBP8123588.1 chorismate mutase [Caldilineaceae bacterium]MBP9072049.1 chorismate mutase [Caldilineaceae bacterium]